MSNSIGIKTDTSATSLGQHNQQQQQQELKQQQQHQQQKQEIVYHDLNLQNSCSELFELKAKPKKTCIPTHCSQLFNDLRKTQSLNVTKVTDYPEKSFSVLFIGSRNHGHQKGRYIM